MAGTIQTEISRHRPTLGFEAHPEKSLLVEDEHALGDESEIGGTAVHGDFADQDTGGVPTDWGGRGLSACLPR